MTSSVLYLLLTNCSINFLESLWYSWNVKYGYSDFALRKFRRSLDFQKIVVCSWFFNLYRLKFLGTLFVCSQICTQTFSKFTKKCHSQTISFILEAVIATVKKPLLRSKPATMRKSAQTSISPNNLKILGLSYSKIKWWAVYIYIKLKRNCNHCLETTKTFPE